MAEGGLQGLAAIKCSGGAANDQGAHLGGQGHQGQRAGQDDCRAIDQANRWACATAGDYLLQVVIGEREPSAQVLACGVGAMAAGGS